MATHKLAILVEAVGAANAAKQLKGVDAAVSRIGARAGQGIRTLTGNLVKLGAIAGVGLGAAVVSGIQDLATLEDAATSVAGAIKATGKMGKVTASEITGWANEIEAASEAAFDDKAITAATATIIRYGKVTTSNIRPAMVIMTDLAAKTGDVDSAATLLAKALADPTKAAGKLARQGIILTKAEQDQIKAFDKAGDAGKAQAVVLAAVERSTKGAAAASAGPYRDALNILADVSEDAKKALAEGFLPVLQRVSAWLSTKLADPKTISDIRSLGSSLAGAFDKAVSFAQNIPWDTVKSAMEMAGKGAKAAYDLFTGLPPWVQTAVLTGWGLNKLTGGALGGIVGEIGKGLIKGVLGMNAGVVNARAGVVNVAGGVGGGAVPVGGKAGGVTGKVGSVVGTVGKVIMVGIAAGVAVELGQQFAQQSSEIRQQGGELVSRTKNFVTAPTTDTTGVLNAIKHIDEQLDPKSWSNLALDVTNGFNGGKDALLETRRVLATKLGSIYEANLANAANLYTINSSIKATTTAAAHAGWVSAEAIRAKNFSPKITVPVYVTSRVSVRDMETRTATAARYGTVRTAL